MASYAIEDIEFIRKKSGVSYEEAVSLLDYHNGDVARVLVDLERKGRMLEKEGSAKASSAAAGGSIGEKSLSFLQRLYRTRVKVQKGEITILNLSILFTLIAVLLFSPHLALVGLLLSLVLGYRISIDTNDPAFNQENLGRMVRSAADNVRVSVSGIARDLGQAIDRKETSRKSEKPSVKAEKTEKEPARAPVSLEKNAAPDLRKEDGAYTGVSAAFVRQAGSPDAEIPTLQVPVRVDSAEGSVSYQEDPNGYGSVTVE